MRLTRDLPLNLGPVDVLIAAGLVLLAMALAAVLSGCQSVQYNVDVAVDAAQTAAPVTSAASTKSTKSTQADPSDHPGVSVTVTVSGDASAAKPIEVSPAARTQASANADAAVRDSANGNTIPASVIPGGN